jgi:hypothetical protein
MRYLPATLCALLLLGCAADPPRVIIKRVVVEKPVPAAVSSAQTGTKIVREKCTTTIEPDPDKVCRHPKHCYQIDTCAEAYYRYTVCRDTSLDRNDDGVPCSRELRGGSGCSRDSKAFEMANRIRAQPFVVPTKEEKSCTRTN